MGESLVYAIKIGLAIACTAAFVAAIITLVSLLVSFVGNSMLGEIIGLISIYLPFNPAPVFATVSSTITAILAFLVAKKVWSMTLVTEDV